MTLHQTLVSVYAYMAVTVFVNILGRRVRWLEPRTVDFLTALSLGLSIGAIDGFWLGAAFIAILSVALFILAYLAGVALGLWRIRHELLAKVLRR